MYFINYTRALAAAAARRSRLRPVRLPAHILRTGSRLSLGLVRRLPRGGHQDRQPAGRLGPLGRPLLAVSPSRELSLI